MGFVFDTSFCALRHCWVFVKESFMFWLLQNIFSGRDILIYKVGLKFNLVFVLVLVTFIELLIICLCQNNFFWSIACFCFVIGNFFLSISFNVLAKTLLQKTWFLVVQNSQSLDLEVLGQ